MQLALLQMCDDTSEEEVEKEEEHLTDKDVLERRVAIQDKIRSVTKFMRMYQTLRDESETVNRIKSLAGASLPKGALLGGRLALERSLSFEPSSSYTYIHIYNHFFFICEQFFVTLQKRRKLMLRTRGGLQCPMVQLTLPRTRN